MAVPLEKPNTKTNPAELPRLMPMKPIEDLFLEANTHPKEVLKKAPEGEPLTPTKQLEIETNAKKIQKSCKDLVDYICRCRYHPEDILIGEASIDTEHFVKPDSITLQQHGVRLITAYGDLTAGTANLVPAQSVFPMEFKYKRPIVDTLKEDISKTSAPFKKVKDTIFSQDVSLETTQQLLDDTVDLVRNTQNVLVQLDKLKAADTINWQQEEAKVERKRLEDEARRVHEEEVRPLRAEKSIIDHFDGLITGFSKLPEQLKKAEALTDPALQELPKYIRHTKDGYEPDPLVSEDDLILCVHPAGVVGLLGLMGVRAIARKANTVKELNPQRPTKEKINSGLRDLADYAHVLKRQVEDFAAYPTTRNPDASWTTMQQVETLRKALPQVKSTLDELEDLPNKQETWNLPTIRAAMLRAESNADLQQVIQSCSELDNERKNLEMQINPPAPAPRRNANPYGFPNWPY
ncbi:MAG: hypothetical protein K2X29_07625 [Candidatus Obscuribacterales bacterium]|nr:hypothetical protein [Candidatus Obscuribacterales bacterium]